jgi:hypothetical protein
MTTTANEIDHKEAHSSALSRSSSTSTINALHEKVSFHPSRTLSIHAHGIRPIRLPLPPTQTEIPIYNTDGSLAYVSTRDHRWSGDAVLSSPKLGDLVRTNYYFGPNRDPVLQLLQSSSGVSQELKVTGKWTSRSTCFVTPVGIQLEWNYAKEARVNGKKANLIVLRVVDGHDTGKSPKGQVIAQLVRCEETRTPGTSRCTAGNGGELQIDNGALYLLHIDEAVVVATCLVMLKREIDRRRLVQTAIITGPGGS